MQIAQARFGGGGHVGGGHFGSSHYYAHGGYDGAFTVILLGSIILFGIFPVALKAYIAYEQRRHVHLTAEQLATLREIFMRLERTWPSNSLMAVRGVLTPACYEQNQLILDRYQELGFYNRLEHIKIQEVTPLRQTKQTLTIAFKASLQDSFVSLTNGKRVDEVGAAMIPQRVMTTHFTEEWTFETTAAGFKLQKIVPRTEYKAPF